MFRCASSFACASWMWMTSRSRDPWKLFLIWPIESDKFRSSKRVRVETGVGVAGRAGAGELLWSVEGSAQRMEVVVKNTVVKKAVVLSHGRDYGFCHSNIRTPVKKYHLWWGLSNLTQGFLLYNIIYIKNFDKFYVKVYMKNFDVSNH